ncbi:MAG: caspase family protein [Candidatus Bipolaricaulota bacterium]
MPEIYKPEYSVSHALIIGIDDYDDMPPLNHAKSDAKEFASVLVNSFEFPEKNITLFLDEEATTKAIRENFLNYQNRLSKDDRIVVFFAGHGHTTGGRTGKVGHLIPVNGSLDEPASLLRWKFFIHNSEAIDAKHILFIMDACYGGLMISRGVSGVQRLAEDMMKRPTRQVLTAGKSDETVLDQGGPRENHSIFTGYLLDALEGNASDENGLITANNVMSYVYEKVGQDPNSQQSPHFGFLEGQGDFIFNPGVILDSNDKPEEGKKVFYNSGDNTQSSVGTQVTNNPADLAKEYLSNGEEIKLEDLVKRELQRSEPKINNESNFPIDPEVTEYSVEEFINRLEKYEDLIENLLKIVVVLGRWGGKDHSNLLTRIVEKLASNIDISPGNTTWLALRWYPVLLLQYAGGIGGLSADNFYSLKALLSSKIPKRGTRGDREMALINATINGFHPTPGFKRIIKKFKDIPDHQKHYVPDSEYLYSTLQPMIEDQILIGEMYEKVFDRFEVFFSLIFAELNYNEDTGRVWGPLGRFAWKFRNRSNNGPFRKLVKEAEEEKEQWPPIKIGLFKGNYERFDQVANGFIELMSNLNWF